jgi:phosphatidate cytidylyltransferase
MKSLFQRLLLFIVALPVIICVLLFLPMYNHFGFSIIVIIVSLLGALEFRNMLNQKNLTVSKAEAVILGGLSPLTAALVVCFGAPVEIQNIVFSLGVFWALSSRVFASKERLDSFINRSAACLAVLIYPGFLMSFIIRLLAFPNAGLIVLFFLLITFLNDSGAWVAGMLFGKRNRGIIPASPNKSVAGFSGGMIVSLILGMAGAWLFPGAFPKGRFHFLVSGAILGLVAGAGAILGDLAESCLKRSAGIKDSGNIMPGRGGMLDCIDSLSTAAPVYYLMFTLLFT